MKNKISTVIFFVFLALLTSCENILWKLPGSDFSFVLGEKTVNSIEKTVLGNSEITESSEIQVKCELQGISSQVQIKNIKLSELKNLKLEFHNIPFGDNYYSVIEILHNGNTIYKGISNKFNLSQNEKEVKVNIQLNKKLATIEYELNGGSLTLEQENNKLTEYFIDTDYIIPVPDKLKNKFDGWYLNPECTGTSVTELGKNNFIGNVKLFAKWSEIYKVTEVTEVKSEVGKGQVTLTWKNPPEPELQKIEIKCNEDNTKSQTLTNKETSVNINGLTNGQKYTFDITAISTSNDRSKTVKKETFALDTTSIKLTESVKTLDPGTDGTAGTSGTYVEFGDYPQSLKAADVLVSENTVKVNGFDCYYGIDGSYYVKAKANMFKYKDTHNVSTKPESLYRFNNEDLIKEGGEYYFKVEPIKWRVVDTAYSDVGPLVGKQQVTGKLLLAERVLNGAQFYINNIGTRSISGKSVESNNYEYSSIRAYLNGYDGSSWGETSNNAGNFTGKGFIDLAFTSAAQSHINEVTVDNGIETTKNSSESSVTTEDYAVWKEHPYSCEPTTDKVFLLSQREATTKKYFPEDWLQFDSFSRYRKTSEYARTVGASSNMDRTSQNGKTYKNGDWWLRSPHWAQFGNNKLYRRSRYIGCNGRANRGNDCHGAYGGVVPAIVIEGTATKDTTAPSTITDLTYKTDNGKVILSWIPPADRDFARVEIICKEDTGKNITVQKGTNTCTISGLTNGQNYTFEATAVDATGNKGKTVSKTVPLYVLTETLTPLTDANGTVGTTGTYYIFGDYPQSVMTKDVSVSTASATINNMTCYYGSDGHYYVKEKAVSYKYDKNNYVFGKFYDGSKVEMGKEYYFKVEPIKWRVLDSNYLGKGGELLFSEKAISSCAYFSYTRISDRSNMNNQRTINGIKVYNNNYEYSKVRAMLNGLAYWDENNRQINEFKDKGFIQQAFTSKALAEIKTINVDNTPAAIGACRPEFVSNNTNDKAFILSYNDVINSEYGFQTTIESDNARKRESTEFARAKGVAYYENQQITWWSIRTPGLNGTEDTGSTFCRVQTPSFVRTPADVIYDTYGVVPAIVVGGTSNADTTAPDPITNPTYTTGNGSVTLNWTKPSDADFAKVKIAYSDGNTSKTTTVLGAPETATISGLTNGKTYSFIITALDSTGNKSTDSAPISVPLYLKTESVVNLPVNTDGSAGTSGTYVEFGDYPQSYVKDAPVTTDKVTVGGIDYYYGTDGHYYVKATAEPYSSSGKNFGDVANTEIVKDHNYWFKVEPVKWRVIANTYGGSSGKVLLAENVLVNKKFKSTTGAGANVYNSSDLKAFVTGNMFNQLFSAIAQGNILQVTGADLSNEKIFILSKDDVSNTDYGFVTDEKANTARSRLTTDYSRALGAYSDINTKNGSWWLRTNAVEDYVYIVGSVGGTGNSETVDNSSGGVVPAIVVKP